MCRTKPPSTNRAIRWPATNPFKTPTAPQLARIKDRGRLIVGVDQTTYLLGYRDPLSGEMDGFDIRIARQIALDLFGDEDAVQFKAMSSAEREPALQEQSVDLVVRSMTINCTRWENVAFSTEYYRAGQKVLVPDTASDDPSDLAGEKVCSAEGSTSLRRIQQELNAIPVSVRDWADCMILLQQGYVAGMSTDDVILAGMAAQDPNTKVIGERISDEPYGVAANKNHIDLVRFVNARWSAYVRTEPGTTSMRPLSSPRSVTLRRHRPGIEMSDMEPRERAASLIRRCQQIATSIYPLADHAGFRSGDGAVSGETADTAHELEGLNKRLWARFDELRHWCDKLAHSGGRPDEEIEALLSTRVKLDDAGFPIRHGLRSARSHIGLASLADKLTVEAENLLSATNRFDAACGRIADKVVKVTSLLSQIERDASIHGMQDNHELVRLRDQVRACRRRRVDRPSGAVG